MKTPTCENKMPFVELEKNGKASILNYNIPQSTCYTIYSPLVLSIPDEYFKPIQVPKDNFWLLAEKLTKEQWIERLSDEISLASSNIFENKEYFVKEKTNIIATKNTITNKFINKDSNNDKFKKTNQQIKAKQKIAGEEISEIADKIKKGFRPILKKNLYGKVYLKYLKRPKTLIPKPYITIQMKLKMCSYLGDYGAGMTVKTFSLLPGERTTITIKTYEHNEEIKNEATNVLDSLTESSANELQEMLSVEKNTNYDLGFNIEDELSFETDASISIPLDAVEIGAKSKMSNTLTTSFNSSFARAIKKLTSSVSKQVSKSDSLRKIEVNTETSYISKNENEQEIVRELQNINKSRTLNFVFRQLNQEYFTITYLDDISFIFTDGFVEHKTVSKLEGIDGFLEKFIVTEKIDEIKGNIIKRLCSLFDYRGTKQSFIESVEDVLSCDIKCPNLPSMENEVECYLRKKQDLFQEYNGVKVNGIILDVTHRVIRTSAVIVDALLGQGEALDCYNQSLQNEAIRQAKLENDKLEQSIEVINALGSADKKAEYYKKVFGDCCNEEQNDDN